MNKEEKRRIFQRFSREDLISILVNETIKNENYRISIDKLIRRFKKEKKELIKENKELKKQLKDRSDVKWKDKSNYFNNMVYINNYFNVCWTFYI